MKTRNNSIVLVNENIYIWKRIKHFHPNTEIDNFLIFMSRIET